MKEKSDDMKNGTLFVVSTPIGNLEDITLRALGVLKSVALIAAEDTRVTRKLLSNYGISTPLTSYFEHNEVKKAAFLLEKLREGADIAIVTDAGTPGISDPGYRIVRLAVENGVRAVSVPGASALTAALSVAGLPLDEFTFKGFVPAGQHARKKFLLGLKIPEHTFIMYESARRIKDTLKDILDVIGDVEAVMARELTKLHEEVLRGRICALAEKLKEREVKGEIVVILRTGDATRAAIIPADEIENLLREGFGLKEVVKAVAQEHDMPKSEIYKEALRVKARLEKKE